MSGSARGGDVNPNSKLPDETDEEFRRRNPAAAAAAAAAGGGGAAETELNKFETMIKQFGQEAVAQIAKETNKKKAIEDERICYAAHKKMISDLAEVLNKVESSQLIEQFTENLIQAAPDPICLPETAQLKGNDHLMKAEKARLTLAIHQQITAPISAELEPYERFIYVLALVACGEVMFDTRGMEDNLHNRSKQYLTAHQIRKSMSVIPILELVETCFSPSTRMEPEEYRERIQFLDAIFKIQCAKLLEPNGLISNIAECMEAGLTQANLLKFTKDMGIAVATTAVVESMLPGLGKLTLNTVRLVVPPLVFTARALLGDTGVAVVCANVVSNPDYVSKGLEWASTVATQIKTGPLADSIFSAEFVARARALAAAEEGERTSKTQRVKDRHDAYPGDGGIGELRPAPAFVREMRESGCSPFEILSQSISQQPQVNAPLFNPNNLIGKAMNAVLRRLINLTSTAIGMWKDVSQIPINSRITISRLDTWFEQLKVKLQLRGGNHSLPKDVELRILAELMKESSKAKVLSVVAQERKESFEVIFDQFIHVIAWKHAVLSASMKNLFEAIDVLTKGPTYAESRRPLAISPAKATSAADSQYQKLVSETEVPGFTDDDRLGGVVLEVYEGARFPPDVEVETLQHYLAFLNRSDFKNWCVESGLYRSGEFRPIGTGSFGTGTWKREIPWQSFIRHDDRRLPAPPNQDEQMILLEQITKLKEQNAHSTDELLAVAGNIDSQIAAAADDLSVSGNDSDDDHDPMSHDASVSTFTPSVEEDVGDDSMGAAALPTVDQLKRTREGTPGGRSRSRKRLASKRTRHRKATTKKQKSKKNKRQSRRKVRRSSSRRPRK